MDLSKKEKFIWNLSAKTEISNIPDKDRVWEILSQQMDIRDDQTSNDPTTNHQIKKWSIWSIFNNTVSLGLSVIIIISLLSISSYNLFFINRIITGLGENKDLTLDDGSKLTINSQSEIKYDKNFNIDNRKVYLSGEAYFNVQKNNIPFVIETNHGKIRVMGTSFNVRTRDDGFEVGVSGGIVKIFNENVTLELSKGEFINVESSFNKNDINKIPYEGYPDWKNQKFYCNYTSLSKLCLEIERTFGIHMKFANPELKNITVSGIIEASDVKSVLRTVSLLTQQEFKLEGDICTII
tara:strand:+ start:8509 stop:9393 length:885 start_codon:yes stop_codon:yes gene_type:complete